MMMMMMMMGNCLGEVWHISPFCYWNSTRVKLPGRLSVFKTAGAWLEVKIRIFMPVKVSVASRILQHVIDVFNTPGTSRRPKIRVLVLNTRALPVRYILYKESLSVSFFSPVICML